MREILFRGWHKPTKKMVDLHKLTAFALSEDMKDSMLKTGDGGLFLPFSDDVILMQHTGLKDADGNSIFEGDIVQGNWINHDIEQKSKFVVSMTYPFYERTGYSSGWLYETSLGEENFRVIGNVHDNPELVRAET